MTTDRAWFRFIGGRSAREQECLMTTILKWRSPTAHARLPILGCVAALSFAVAGCGGSSSTGTHASAYGAATPTKASQSAPAPAATGSGSVAIANSKLGKILVDSKGDTLYLWQADTGAASTCTGACASAWPPLITHGKPIAGPGVSASKLGTTRRNDGTTEVTYNGHPLYTFVGDSGPGQTSGEGNQGFGAEWDVLSATGNKVEIGS
jgi:predicted lipoprotein with Yx(FWY)xxD motif